MTNEEQIKLIEESREQLHRMIDERYDELLLALKSGQSISNLTSPAKLSLTTAPAIFKGRKPASVVLPDGQEQITPTWKSVVSAILKDCNADEERHRLMMELCGCTAGRFRTILTHDPFELNVPLKIDSDIYFEGKFDTEYLLKMMKERVLDYVGYDYRNITVTLKPKEQPIQSESEDVQDISHDDIGEGFSQQMM